MANPIYEPPGVTVVETVNPSISPILATSSTVCLVGLAEGLITKTVTVELEGEKTVTLPGVETEDTMTAESIVKVTNALDPNGESYAEGKTGYEFEYKAHTVARGSESTIPNNGTVEIVYTYTPANYYAPVILKSAYEVEKRFGTAETKQGAINSILSYGAGIAFENGAQEVILQPLFYNNSGTKQQPSSTQAAEPAVWGSNFENLRTIPTINVIVPVVGQSATSVSNSVQLKIIQEAQNFLKFMRTYQSQYVILLSGEDSSVSSAVAQAVTLREHAATLAARYAEISEQTILVSPSKYLRATFTSESSSLVPVGGQYVACAIAGMLASRPVSQSLTRKPVTGFASVAERRTVEEKNADAAAGLLEVENKGNVVQIRHAITINTEGGSAKREISVVRAKQAVIESLQDTIETQIIGNVIADGEAPLVVRSTVISVLEELRLAGDIVEYSNVQAATASLDPTVIEVRFSYRPAFPVNYVDISFSLDLTTGTIGETLSE